MDMNDHELSDLIRAQGSYHRASDQLRAKVRTQLALATAARLVTPPEEPQMKPTAPPERDGKRAMADVFGWRGVTVGFLLGVTLTVMVGSLAPKPSLSYSTEEELVADHVRSLRVGPLFQVESADRHTVKPWFQGKLDYAPPVIDLADEGYPLLGARVEHIDKESVATLVYGRHAHRVNVFVWPSNAHADAKITQVKGFNVMHWSDPSMQFWVVSDMDQAELQRFGQLLQLRPK